ncbi:hypothetical protein Tco_1341077, partial [Tanacetum coccineum]
MIECKVMRTLASVEFESILILGLPCCPSSSSVRCLENVVPAPFPKDPYEAIRQACLVETYTESEPFEDPIDTETPESPYTVASPTLLPDSTPPACYARESEDSDTSGARSTSSDSTAPLSPDHPLTRTSPTPTPTRASFYQRTARITVSAQPVMSPVRKRYRGTSELILDTNSEEDKIGDEDNEDEGHGLDDEGHSIKSDRLGLEGEEEVVPKGQGSGSVPEIKRPERVSALRQPTLTTWIDPEDSSAYIDVLAYPPPVLPIQTSPSLEWSSGSLHVSPAASAVPSPISSPMISLTVPLPIASPVATLTATILVDEDQFIEIGAQLELYEGIIEDHTQRLDVMPPTLFMDIDRDVRELYT